MNKTWQEMGVSNDGIFPLTLGYIKDRFDDFNGIYFDGKLSSEGIYFYCDSDSSTTREHRLGRVTISQRNDGTSYISAFRIGDGMASRGGRTEKVWCEIILHEMIHVYQVQVLGVSARYKGDWHGSDFKKKMDEINEAGGWGVGVTETDEESRSFIPSDARLKSVKDNKICAFTCKHDDGNTFFTLIYTKDISRLKMSYSELEPHCYKLLSMAPFSQMQVSKEARKGRTYDADEMKSFFDGGVLGEELAGEADERPYGKDIMLISVDYMYKGVNKIYTIAIPAKDWPDTKGLWNTVHSSSNIGWAAFDVKDQAFFYGNGLGLERRKSGHYYMGTGGYTSFDRERLQKYVNEGKLEYREGYGTMENEFKESLERLFSGILREADDWQDEDDGKGDADEGVLEYEDDEGNTYRTFSIS